MQLRSTHPARRNHIRTIAKDGTSHTHAPHPQREHCSHRRFAATWRRQRDRCNKQTTTVSSQTVTSHSKTITQGVQPSHDRIVSCTASIRTPSASSTGTEHSDTNHCTTFKWPNSDATYKGVIPICTHRNTVIGSHSNVRVDMHSTGSEAEGSRPCASRKYLHRSTNPFAAAMLRGDRVPC
jgi:hypothetical protein